MTKLKQEGGRLHPFTAVSIIADFLNYIRFAMSHCYLILVVQGRLYYKILICIVMRLHGP